MRKFNGVPQQHFVLFLKECEWRFNLASSKEQLFDLKKLLKEFY
jgi:transposase